MTTKSQARNVRLAVENHEGHGPSKKKYDTDGMIIHPLTLERQ
jgi:hypothetical protein